MSSVAATAASHPGPIQQVEQYLTFELAAQQYGVEILCVQEIKGWEKPTRLPHSPEYVQGVINLRGVVIPIIDLRRRFGLGDTQLTRTTVVIVVRVDAPRGPLSAGLVVDGVCEVCSIGPDSLRPAPALGSSPDAQFVRALAITGDRVLVLLDLLALISRSLGSEADQCVPLAPQAA